LSEIIDRRFPKQEISFVASKEKDKESLTINLNLLDEDFQVFSCDIKDKLISVEVWPFWSKHFMVII